MLFNVRRGIWKELPGVANAESRWEWIDAAYGCTREGGYMSDDWAPDVPKRWYATFEERRAMQEKIRWIQPAS